MKISARNVLPGIVASLIKGDVNSEVILSLSGGETVVAMITNPSVERVGLHTGAEAFAIMPHFKAVVLHGEKKQRLRLLEDPQAEIFIINHDGLKTIEYELAARKDIDTLVLDELAVYRNNSQRTKRMKIFAERFTWVWGMTGRPMPNQPTDVWNQCRIITPTSVPKYFKYARSILM